MKYCDAREHEGIAMAWPTHWWLFLLRREFVPQHNGTPPMMRWDLGSRRSKAVCPRLLFSSPNLCIALLGEQQSLGHRVPWIQAALHTLTKFSWLSSPNLKSSEQYNQ